MKHWATEVEHRRMRGQGRIGRKIRATEVERRRWRRRPHLLSVKTSRKYPTRKPERLSPQVDICVWRMIECRYLMFRKLFRHWKMKKLLPKFQNVGMTKLFVRPHFSSINPHPVASLMVPSLLASSLMQSSLLAFLSGRPSRWRRP